MNSPQRVTVRELVAATGACPRTGEQLDEDTCVVILDAAGAPAFVLSQAGWRQVAEEEWRIARALDRQGYRVDEATVRSPSACESGGS